MNIDPIGGAFGLPPSSYVSDSMIENSMPIFEVMPCIPQFNSGLNLFKVVRAGKEYQDILSNHGFDTQVPLKFAFMADNFPTDSFVNDYGETFLQKFTDVASQGMSQIAQMMGAQKATDAGKEIGQAMQATGKEMTGVMGDILSGIGSGVSGVSTGIEQAANSKAVRDLIGGGGEVVNKMLAGHRVDFPQVWRNSSYTPSYTATVRLYNPNPANPASTKKYIIGPLAALLCLSLPHSDDGSTYNWPFFHKIKSKGIYNLDPAVITNITVVKGGDQQQIAFNQNLSMVDVRVDFTSLYNSLIVEEKGAISTNRPTLRTYLDALSKQGTVHSRNVMNQQASSLAGRGTIQQIKNKQLTKLERNLIVKNEMARKRNGPGIIVTEPDNRTNPIDKLIQTKLEELGIGFT